MLQSSGIGAPSIYHGLLVIFLEYFAWGLLTMPVINVLNKTFPDHTFLMNGLVMGIKGILSFLSAPLIGALSDVWGRKFFLLVTVFFTCAPIPLMSINSWWVSCLFGVKMANIDFDVNPIIECFAGGSLPCLALAASSRWHFPLCLHMSLMWRRLRIGRELMAWCRQRSRRVLWVAIEFHYHQRL